jgi:hypothetical protein
MKCSAPQKLAIPVLLAKAFSGHTLVFTLFVRPGINKIHFDDLYHGPDLVHAACESGLLSAELSTLFSGASDHCQGFVIIVAISYSKDDIPFIDSAPKTSCPVQFNPRLAHVRVKQMVVNFLQIWG